MCVVGKGEGSGTGEADRQVAVVWPQLQLTYAQPFTSPCPCWARLCLELDWTVARKSMLQKCCTVRAAWRALQSIGYDNLFVLSEFDLIH